jgi:hypothetical protein
MPASPRISDRAPIPCHVGAHVLRRDFREHFQRRRAAEMLGHEGEELGGVALIGFRRLRRHAPLGRKMRQPAFEFRGDVGIEN